MDRRRSRTTALRRRAIRRRSSMDRTRRALPLFMPNLTSRSPQGQYGYPPPSHSPQPPYNYGTPPPGQYGGYQQVY